MERQHCDSFELSVSNGGDPIQAGDIDRLFQPSFRGAVRPSRQGWGLGLFIAHEIATAHGERSSWCRLLQKPALHSACNVNCWLGAPARQSLTGISAFQSCTPPERYSTLAVSSTTIGGRYGRPVHSAVDHRRTVHRHSDFVIFF